METGIVKTWNSSKGYGFIASERGEEIFAHHTGIIAEGFRDLAIGDKVKFKVVEGPKGLQAQNIVKIS